MDAALRLADMQAAGKIRHIGMTNFDVPRLMEMMDAGVPIASNQVGSMLRFNVRYINSRCCRVQRCLEFPFTGRESVTLCHVLE